MPDDLIYLERIKNLESTISVMREQLYQAKGRCENFIAGAAGSPFIVGMIHAIQMDVELALDPEFLDRQAAILETFHDREAR